MAIHTPNSLEGRVGSRLAPRMLGGGMAIIYQFPVFAAASATLRPEGTLVATTSRDDLGFGVKTDIRKKYEYTVGLLADQLIASISEPPRPTMIYFCPAGHPTHTTDRYCGSVDNTRVAVPGPEETDASPCFGCCRHVPSISSLHAERLREGLD